MKEHTEADEDKVSALGDSSSGTGRIVVGVINGPSDNASRISHGGPDTQVFASFVDVGVR
jgi:hypothetical protein